jgi:hypothetical protein
MSPVLRVVVMKKNGLVALAICCFRILYPFSADVRARARFLSLCFFSVPILNQQCFLGSHHVCFLVLPVISSFL